MSAGFLSMSPLCTRRISSYSPSSGRTSWPPNRPARSVAMSAGPAPGDVLMSSSPRRERNPARGKPCRSRATAKRSLSGAAVSLVVPEPFSIASTNSSSRSAGSRSGISLIQSRPQAPKRAELELLPGPPPSPEGPGDLGDAPSLGKSHLDDAPLVRGQLADRTIERRTSLSALVFVPPRLRVDGHHLVSHRAVVMVGDGIGRDTVEPGSERNPAPLELPEVGPRLLKDLGGHVLRVGASGNTPRDVGIDPVKMHPVEIGEAARVALRGLDQELLVELTLDHRLPCINRREGRRLRSAVAATRPGEPDSGHNGVRARCP